MKIKLFTHTDLDGVGCAIIANVFFGKENVDVEYCEYNDIDNAVFEHFSNNRHLDYDFTFITDISVNSETANGLSEYPIQLLDHHKSALWLNDYDWAKVVVDEENPESGTSLFYNYLTSDDWYGNNFDDDDDIELSYYSWFFAKQVKLYDTWQWKKNNDLLPKKYNDLFHILGRDNFTEQFTKRIADDEDRGLLNLSDENMLNIEQSRINCYIDKKMKSVIFGKYNGHDYGLVFAESNISELGNKICTEYSVDFSIIVIMPQSLSFRSIGDFDVSLIAKEFGGGGHRNASGCSILNPQIYSILKTLKLQE